MPGGEVPDPPAQVDFEDENGQDAATALDHTRTLKLEFAPDDVTFWFTQIENEMYTCGVKSQWMKRCVLVKNLPPKIQSDVKALLTLKQSEAPTNLYKKIKMEILRIHAPAKEDNFKKALSRVLVGLPSQLGHTLINDICSKPVKLDGCCCHMAVYALWTIQLPLNVRSYLANLDFNKDTCQAVFEAADKVFLSSRPPEVSAGVAAITQPAPSSSTTSADQSQVAAVRPSGPRRTQRGRANRGRGGSNSSGTGQSRPARPSSTTEAPSGCCNNHKKWAGDAWYCLEPLTCPWVNKISAKPTAENKNK